MAMVMGVMIHYVYLTTRSLLAPMLVHFLNNSLAVTLARLPALSQLDKAQGEPLIPLYTGAALLLFGVCWALYQTRARLVSEGESAWRPPWPGVACPPPDSGTRIETPMLSGTSTALVAAGMIAFFAGLAMALQRIG
jgi:hypothetical protein